MSRKNDIINNPREYSSEEIAQAVKDGELTIYELSKGGNMTPLMKKRIEEKLVELNTPKQVGTHDSEIEQDQNSSQAPLMNNGVKGVDEGTESEPMEFPNFVLPQAPQDTAIAEVEEPIANNSDYVIDEIDNFGMFRRPFSFQGRIRRTEYGISFIMYVFGSIIVDAILKSPGTTYNTAVFVYFLYYIPGLWFFWAQGCKRCHDRGNSGWWQIIPLYPFVLIFGDGEPGSNNYGNNPKGL